MLSQAEISWLPFATPAISQPSPQRKIPAPPPGGTMGFVVTEFVSPIVPGQDACPHGTAPRLRELYLRSLPEAEQARLRLKENELELTKGWHGYAFDGKGANVCSQPDMFNRSPFPAVESRNGMGLDLDGGATDADTCAHDNFQSPAGERGIDNQEYRALGCTLEWRGADGNGGDTLRGMKQFFVSGEWTQVLLLKGVDSLTRDDDVEVIYANTPDRPVIDTKDNWLPGTSFTISDTGARHRNVLHGRIVDGVLTTDPADIRLAQTWGQGVPRDIRGARSTYDYQKGRLRLEFQPDGGLRGYIGGYRDVYNVIISTMLGGEGSALSAGIDCSATLATLKKYADGIRDPKSGKCTAVSSAMRMTAIPAFVTDIPAATRSALR
ncbi:MAG: hypothetical protein ABIT04_09720 [Novosphingobium sp.]